MNTNGVAIAQGSFKSASYSDDQVKGLPVAGPLAIQELALEGDKEDNRSVDEVEMTDKEHPFGTRQMDKV